MAVEARRLSYFIQIAESGSLSKAAETLHIAQPALSRQIHILEDYLEFPLFVRTGRGMQLTAEGKYLRDAVAGPLREIELAIENMRTFMAHGFSFGIGVHTGLGPVVSTSLLSALEKKGKNASFHFQEATSSVLLESLRQGAIDFALVDYATGEKGVTFRPLAMEDLVLVGGVEKRKLQHITLKQLLKRSLILPRAQHGVRAIIDEAAKQIGSTLSISVETDSLTLTCELAKQKRGDLLCPRSLARIITTLHRGLQLTEIRPAMKIGIYLATRGYGEVEGSTIGEVEKAIEAVVTASVQ